MSLLAPSTLANEPGSRLRLEELIVTARKREESLQDISESITAFSSADIEDGSISNLKAVVALTPNTILNRSYRLGVVNLSSRGHETPQQGDAPMVISFDGAVAPAQDFINQDLFDIERIEVLRGVQGALYGQGAIAGAINVITKRPANELESAVHLRAGNESSYRLGGSVSGPIVDDTLLFRLAAVYSDSGGFIDNTVRGDKADPYEEFAIRASIFANLERVGVDFRLSYTDTTAGNAFYDSVPFKDPTNPALGIIDSEIEFKNNSNLPTTENRQLFNSTLKLNIELGEGELTSVTSYSTSEQDNFGDLDFTPDEVPFGIQDVRFDVDVINQEIRYSSDDSNSFRWVMGVFAQEREIYNQFIIPQLIPANTIPAPTVLDPSLYNYTPLAFDQRMITESSSYGAFINTSYDLSNALILNLALRYDSDEVEDTYTGESATLLADPLRNVTRTFDELQPKVGLSYHWAENSMAYINLAHGFRSGGANPLNSSTTLSGTPRILEAEIVDSIEVGLKTYLMEERVLLDIALFNNDIENRQNYFFGANLQNMVNVNDATAKGVEFALAAAATDYLNLELSFGLIDSEIDDFDGTALNVGNKLPMTPESTFGFTANYRQPLSNSDSEFFGRLAYKRIGKIYHDSENLIVADEHPELDIRFGIEKDSWNIAFFVENATDERTFLNYAGVAGNNGSVLPNRPRRYGIETRYQF